MGGGRSPQTGGGLSIPVTRWGEMVYLAGFMATSGHEMGEMVYLAGFMATSGHDQPQMGYPSTFVATQGRAQTHCIDFRRERAIG